MPALRAKSLPIRTSADIVKIRQVVRDWAAELTFSLVDQTKLVTAASELARNAVEHAGGGVVHLEVLNDGARKGLRMTFEDQGPGISDIHLAFTDGYSTSGGLGLGLGGARRLVNELRVESDVGRGTRVQATQWR